MTRHRSLLITLGIVQLLAAGLFFTVEGGMLAKYAGPRFGRPRCWCGRASWRP